MQADFLGQLVAPPANQGLSPQAANEIKQAAGQAWGKKVDVLVTSNKPQKMQAAKDSVVAWVKALFNERVGVEVKGFKVSSGIDEQPHGLDHTKQGAANRLTNMKKELLEKERISENTGDGVLRVLVSLENGIMKERVPNLKNPNVFLTEGEVWVDRCLEQVEIWLQGRVWRMEAASEGVTTPKEQVEKSAGANWGITAGTFIEEKYHWPNDDWHAGIAGKSRKFIMEELAKATLGIPSYTMPMPKKVRDFKPDEGFLQYNSQSIDFFTPKDIDAVLAKEITSKKQKTEFWNSWRDNAMMIPQPIHNGEPIIGLNGQPINHSGPVLTEDLLLGYFDEIEDPRTKEKRDVLHLVLCWGKEGKWVMPGKRDRAYEGDLSVPDANCSLMEKMIGLDSTNIVDNVVLGDFDDRKREERMITNSMISFMLVNQKPKLEPGKKIGVPLNVLVKLVQGEILIPRYPWDAEGHGMGLNHDSLLLTVFKTAAFYSTMERVKHQQIKFKERGVYPPLGNIDQPYECGVCFDVMVKATLVCTRGHSVCGICVRALQNCTLCATPINPLPNLGLDDAVKLRYPEEYAERFRVLDNRNAPATWRNDPSFTGSFIHF